MVQTTRPTLCTLQSIVTVTEKKLLLAVGGLMSNNGVI